MEQTSGGTSKSLLASKCTLGERYELEQNNIRTTLVARYTRLPGVRPVVAGLLCENKNTTSGPLNREQAQVVKSFGVAKRQQ